MESAVCSMTASTCAGVRLGSADNMSAATPARLAEDAEVPKKSLRPPGTEVAIPSTPDTATGLSRSGEDSAVPLLANSNSVPAPDEEKLSLVGEKPNAGVSAALTAPAVMAPGVMEWTTTVPVFEPLIVAGKPSPQVISLNIRPASVLELEVFSMAT